MSPKLKNEQKHCLLTCSIKNEPKNDTTKISIQKDENTKSTSCLSRESHKIVSKRSNNNSLASLKIISPKKSKANDKLMEKVFIDSEEKQEKVYIYYYFFSY